MVTRFIRAGYFKEAIGTFRAGSNYHLFITDLGVMEFRKQLAPLFFIAGNKSKLEFIINENVGNDNLKNKINEFFVKNNTCNEDEFDAKLHNFTDDLGLDSVIWIFKLILSSTETK
jgi:hypothetical protein